MNGGADTTPAFKSSHTGCCDCCAVEGLPVMAFNDEYGCALCEPCYVALTEAEAQSGD